MVYTVYWWYTQYTGGIHSILVVYSFCLKGKAISVCCEDHDIADIAVLGLSATVRMSQRYKIVLLGEGRVGKTSILLRYIRGEYSDQQVSTLQASYLDKKITVAGTSVQLSVWDTAGI